MQRIAVLRRNEGSFPLQRALLELANKSLSVRLVGYERAARPAGAFWRLTRGWRELAGELSGRAQLVRVSEWVLETAGRKESVQVDRAADTIPADVLG